MIRSNPLVGRDRVDLVDELGEQIAHFLVGSVTHESAETVDGEHHDARIAHMVEDLAVAFLTPACDRRREELAEQ